MSIIGYPYHWPLIIPHSDFPDLSGNKAVQKLPAQELRAKVMHYLHEKFSLTESDLCGHDALIRLFMESTETFSSHDRLIIFHTSLFRRSVQNALNNLDVDTSDEAELEEITEIVREKIGTAFEAVETFLEGYYPFEAVQSYDDHKIGILRQDALDDMKRHFSGLIADWRKSPYMLDDDQMSERFLSRHGTCDKFMSTYFDSAFIGFVDKNLQKDVDRRATVIKTRFGFPKFMYRMKKRIAHSLEPVESDEDRRFTHERISFHENGQHAFSVFRKMYMPRGSRVLVAQGEYEEILKEMRENGIEITPFSDPDELAVLLHDGHFDFILVSEVSRLGSVADLARIHEARQLLSDHTKLIVDSCQSAGRWHHDMKQCEADAVILSTQKGSDLGDGVGVLALARDFAHENITRLGGTLGHERIARTAFAMNPEGLPTLSPKQRAAEISDRVQKFSQLLTLINQQTGGRIKINPPVHSGSGFAGHAMELRISGLKRGYVCEEAAKYGIFINSDEYGSSHHESFRIAFHPYMNHESLLILARVLWSFCEENPEH